MMNIRRTNRSDVSLRFFSAKFVLKWTAWIVLITRLGIHRRIQGSLDCIRSAVEIDRSNEPPRRINRTHICSGESPGRSTPPKSVLAGV